MNDEEFWINNPMILIDNFLKFIPDKKMNPNEKLNTVMRYFIYIGIGAGLYTKKFKNFFIWVIIGAIITLLYNKNGQEMFEDTQSTNQNKQNTETNIPTAYQGNMPRDYTESDKKYATERTNEVNKDNNDNKLLEKEYNTFEINQPENIMTTLKVDKSKCVRPNANNPLMNPLSATDTDPCDITDESVVKEVKENYYKNLYRDVDDIYSRQNSERQFYSMPRRYDYADQEILAKWLYNNENSCKQNTKACYGQ